MLYKFYITVQTDRDEIIGDKERIAAALERVPGVKRIEFPEIKEEYRQMQMK